MHRSCQRDHIQLIYNRQDEQALDLDWISKKQNFKKKKQFRLPKYQNGKKWGWAKKAVL